MQEISLSEYQNQSKQKPKPSLPTNRIVPFAAAIVLIALSFVGGMQYQKGKTTSTTRAATTQAGSRSGNPAGLNGGFQRGNRAVGTVTSISTSSITIQGRNGSDKTYVITSSTAVTDGGQASSISSIQSGDRVFLTLDSSNAKNVTVIAVNPDFGGGMGGQPTSNSSTSDSQSTDSSTI